MDTLKVKMEMTPDAARAYLGGGTPGYGHMVEGRFRALVAEALKEYDARPTPPTVKERLHPMVIVSGNIREHVEVIREAMGIHRIPPPRLAAVTGYTVTKVLAWFAGTIEPTRHEIAVLRTGLEEILHQGGKR